MLSPDFRGCATVVATGLSSLDRPPVVGVVVDVRLGDLVPVPAAAVDLSDGVDGRLVDLCVARLSSSARRSCSDCEAVACLVDVLDELLLVGFEASVPKSSICANNSLLVGVSLAFFEAIFS